MNEKMSPNENFEDIPSEEKVFEKFNTIFNGEKFGEKRKLSDEKGVYLWEFVKKLEDGSTVEYGYMRKSRKGEFKEGSAIRNAIHVTFYDKDGIPEGGHDVEIL